MLPDYSSMSDHDKKELGRSSEEIPSAGSAHLPQVPSQISISASRKNSILVSDNKQPAVNAHPHFIGIGPDAAEHTSTRPIERVRSVEVSPATSARSQNTDNSTRAPMMPQLAAVAGLTRQTNSQKNLPLSNDTPTPSRSALKQPSHPRIPQDDGKIHILIGVTGSLHVSCVRQMIVKLQHIYGNRVAIQVVLTKAAEKIIPRQEISPKVVVWHDEDEWAAWNSRSDPVIHIELRRWADILVVAPLSANTLGKIALGLCDNLLTNIIRAWNAQYPILIAPALVSYAYAHPATKWHLRTISEEMKWFEILRPTEKVAGSEGRIGMGGMMAWNEIVDKIVLKLGGYPNDDEEDEDEDGEGSGASSSGDLDDDDEEDDDEEEGDDGIFEDARDS